MKENRRPGKPTLGDVFGDLLASLRTKIEPPSDAETGPLRAKSASVSVSLPPMVRQIHKADRRLADRHAAKTAPDDRIVAVKRPASAPAFQRPQQVTKQVSPAVLDFHERRKRAAAQVRAAVVAAFTVIDEARPGSVSQETADAVAAAIASGSRVLANRPGPDLSGFIVGIDFGTSALKLAVAQPYQAGDPVRAMETPPCLRAPPDRHPHLWPTVVWYNRATAAFTLVPMPGCIALDGFKAGLISGQGHRPADPALDVTKSEACAAFLALQLAHLFGWYAREKPLASAGAAHFLSVNIGVPVQSMDQRPIVDAFNRVVQASHYLAAHASNLTLPLVRKVVAEATAVRPPGFELVPELAAAIAGYAADPTTPSGPHVLVDVGAATLDIVAFNLLERGQRISVMASGVEMFGAASLQWARLGNIADNVFKDACDHQFDAVYGHAGSPERDPRGFHPAHRGASIIRLVTTGGGCATELHGRFIDEMIKPGVLGVGPVGRPVPPTWIASSPCDRSRLLVAYGLTRDVPAIARCRLPSEIEDLPRRPQLAGHEPISKDMV